jgi:glycerol-3-phosphate acyltransferase PlsY
MLTLLVITVSYLLGSANTTRIYFGGKLDGNAGTSNVIRTKGTAVGLIIFVIDAGKGIAIAYIGRKFGLPEWTILLCGISGIAGHSWPVFFNFQKGGKGIAILTGVLFWLHPITLSIIFTASLLFLLPKKQMWGFVPFFATSTYIGVLLIPQEKIAWMLVLMGIAILFVIFARRLHTEWREFCEAPSKWTALRNLVIYDRINDHPPPRPEKVDWLISKAISIFKKSPST